MPDDLLPAVTESAEQTTTAEPSAPSVDDVYSSAYAETMLGDDGAAAPPPQGAEQTQPLPASTDQPNKSFMTQGQLQVLSRAQIDPAALGNLEPTAAALFVEQLRQSQSAQDTMGAQLARMQQQLGLNNQPQPQQAQPPATPFRQRLDEVFNKLAESYDDDIKPIAELLSELDQRYAQSSQQSDMVSPMSELLQDMVLESTLGRFTKDYPSLDQPQVRDQVIDRFWTEWQTGAYAKPGASLRSQVAAAVENAVKVTFLNTNEHTAAANLVQQNKMRVASQPKVGPSNTRPKPLSGDDIYDEAFKQTIGQELAARR